jgi:hypothetical protein
VAYESGSKDQEGMTTLPRSHRSASGGRWLPLAVERLHSGSYYVTSPSIEGLGLVASDLNEAAEDLPWVIERLIWLQDHVPVRVRDLGQEPLAAALDGPNPALELVPASSPPGDTQP